MGDGREPPDAPVRRLFSPAAQTRPSQPLLNHTNTNPQQSSINRNNNKNLGQLQEDNGTAAIFSSANNAKYNVFEDDLDDDDEGLISEALLAVASAEEYATKILKLQQACLTPLKEDLADWLNKIMNMSTITTDNFMDKLDNGVIICRLAKVISLWCEQQLATTAESNQPSHVTNLSSHHQSATLTNTHNNNSRATTTTSSQLNSNNTNQPPNTNHQQYPVPSYRNFQNFSPASKLSCSTSNVSTFLPPRPTFVFGLQSFICIANYNDRLN